MDINYANMTVLRTAVSTKFKDAYNATPKDRYDAFAETIPMTTGTIDMPMLEQLTGMREWIDERVIGNLNTQLMTVKARKFEESKGIPREAVEDDTYGIYSKVFQQMGVNAANLKSDLVEEILAGASSHYWIDGKKFFAADRKYGKNTINNYSTNELTKENFKTAYDLMRGYMGHGDKSLKVMPSILVHGPAKRWVAKAILDNPMESVNGAALPNDTYNICSHIEIDGLGNKWFLFAAQGVFKPVGYFERIRPDHITRMDSDKDPVVFLQDKFVFGSRGRANAAFTIPHLAYFGNAS